jgi:hypothetical protein
VTGTDVVFPTVAIGPLGPALSYDNTTGVVTFLQPGTFEVIYGVSSGGSDGGSPAEFAAIVDGTTLLPQSRYARPFLTGDTDIPTIAFMVTVITGQTLAIRNAGATVAIGGAGISSLAAFMTVKQVA